MIKKWLNAIRIVKELNYEPAEVYKCVGWSVSGFDTQVTLTNKTGHVLILKNPKTIHGEDIKVEQDYSIVIKEVK